MSVTRRPLTCVPPRLPPPHPTSPPTSAPQPRVVHRARPPAHPNRGRTQPMPTNPLRRRLLQLAVSAVALPAALLPLTANPAAAAAAAPTFTRIEGAAADAAGLQPTVDLFRTLLGDPNNGSTPGSQPAGRREINWDGTPDAQSSPNALPRDFFNTTAPRGVVFSSGAGNKFQVSANTENPTHTPVRFGNL